MSDEEPQMSDVEITELKSRRAAESREVYSKMRTERERATFAMMMRMNPEALTKFRKEFFARQDEITLDEFIYIIQKHLTKSTGFETKEQREFGMKMYELFQDIDVNGDGNLEWQEFTTYVVEKANLLNKRLKLTSIPHYYDSSESLDSTAQYRHRHDISKMVNIPSLQQFAMVEDHKNSIFVFNSRLGKHVTTINTEAAPVALEYVPEILVSSNADMTLATYSLDDPNPNRRYKQKSTWATPGVQMSLAYMPANNLLYSAGTNGNVYSWKIADRSLVSTFSGHSDIVMALTILRKLNNVASGSLDKTVNVWDSYTNARILQLHGHKKGVLDMTYSPDYRLLFSCGFEHDACIWSPFVNSLVYRLKGHHASLVGIQAIEDTPEIITADISGVFKLWDVRNYQCVQTFMTNLTGSDTKDSSKLCCFFQTSLPPRWVQQKEDDSRIYAASKMLFSFDQARVVHDATTDFSAVNWIGWSATHTLFFTASENNIIVWDALIGSKTVTNSDICGEEISACCLDDRKRKIVIGDITGRIGVYNPANGAPMKTVHSDIASTVVALEYVDDARRFIAGYGNGVMCIFDENSLEDCFLIRTFESFNMHPELLCLSFNPGDRTVATAGASSGIARLWDYTIGKSEVELKVCDPADYVIHVTYLHPYPLVATSDSKGNVIVWGSRGCRWTGIRIGGFMNQTPPTSEYEPPVYVGRDNDELPRRTLPIGHHHHHHQQHQEHQQHHEQQPPGSMERMDDDSIDSRVNEDAEVVDPRSPAGKDKKLETDKEEDEIIDDTPSARSAREIFAEGEVKWGKVTPAQCIGFDPINYLLFTGDDLGNLRCFSLKYMMQDIGGAAMLTGDKFRLKETCINKHRDHQSAVPPIFDISRYFLLGRRRDAMSFLGVEFCWALEAHHDRVICCRMTPNGILTSAADRLVKMWTFEGRPIGTLLQSVPSGLKSADWNLELDAQALMDKEEVLLDQMVEEVEQLTQKEGLPNIINMDFSGIEPGSDAAAFSRSELRQRIEMTSGILGIDFPTESEQRRRAVEGILDDDDTELGASVASVKSKSLKSALNELKSSSAAVDYDLKNKKLSQLQKRRKATKMGIVSSIYGEKGGMKISTTGEHSVGISAEDALEVESLVGKNHAKKAVADDVISVSTTSSTSRKAKAAEEAVLAARARRKKAEMDVGPRAELERSLCGKHSAFFALDRALGRMGVSGADEPTSLTEQDLEAIKQRREEKLNRLLGKTSTGKPFDGFISSPPSPSKNRSGKLAIAIDDSVGGGADTLGGGPISSPKVSSPVASMSADAADG